MELIESDRATILFSLNESYAGPAWHGPSVRESLDGVSARVAASKLSPSRNSIWDPSSLSPNNSSAWRCTTRITPGRSGCLPSSSLRATIPLDS
jgi:hypothetical protein